MKTINILISLFFFSLLSSFHTVHAEQCFPQGSITVSLPGSTGQTTHAVVSPMGAITIDYPNGPLQGKIDTLGHFTASNDYTTVSGNVNTSCSNTTVISPTPSLCTQPYASGCTQESDYQSIVTSSGLYGTTNETYVINQLSTCRKQIDDYQTATANWQKCIKDSYGYDTQTKTWGATLTQIENKKAQADTVTKNQQACFAKNGLYRESSGSCFCKSGESFNEYGACAPKETKIGTSTISTASQYSCPLNSTLGSDNFCKCNTGFGNNGKGLCVPSEQARQEVCPNIYGESHYNNVTGSCDCNSGYVLENGTGDKSDKCISLKNWCQKYYGKDDDPACKVKDNDMNNATSSKRVPKIDTVSNKTPVTIPKVKTVTSTISASTSNLLESTTTQILKKNIKVEKPTTTPKTSWLKKINNFLSGLHF